MRQKEVRKDKWFEWEKEEIRQKEERENRWLEREQKRFDIKKSKNTDVLNGNKRDSIERRERKQTSWS